MKVLVSGASGLTGFEVVAALQGRGADVVGVSRRTVASSPAPNIRLVAANCSDAIAMTALLKACDVFVHVAGIRLAEDLARLDALRAPETVLAVSTTAVHSKFRASAVAYRAGELALRQVRPDAILVRPTMIYGSSSDRNIHHVIDFADRFGFLPTFGRGGGLVQPIHFRDLADAICSLIAAPKGQTVEAGGGQRLRIRELEEAVFAALGRRARFVPLPMTTALIAVSVVDRLRGTRLRERLLRMNEDRVVDNTELEILTGRRPRDFWTGIRDQVRDRATAERG